MQITSGFPRRFGCLGSGLAPGVCVCIVPPLGSQNTSNGAGSPWSLTIELCRPPRAACLDGGERHSEGGDRLRPDDGLDVSGAPQARVDQVGELRLTVPAAAGC
jgi:hypothetical protein